MPMKVVKTLLAFALTASILVPTLAQDPVKQDPVKQDDTVRITTNLVQIDVVVTDKNGKQVTDLRPEDFEVSEQGKKKPLTHFSYIATGKSAVIEATPAESKSAEPVKPAQLKREQVRRTVALVIDDLGLSFESFGY